MKKLILLSALTLLITGCSIRPRPLHTYHLLIYDEHGMIIIDKTIQMSREPIKKRDWGTVELPDYGVVTSINNTILIEEVESEALDKP